MSKIVIIDIASDGSTKIEAVGGECLEEVEALSKALGKVTGRAKTCEAPKQQVQKRVQQGGS